MISHWRTRLARCFGAAVVITGGLVATLPSPVAAEELRLRDPSRDMWSYTDQDAYARAPGHSYGDFVRAKFVHTATRVVVTSTFVEVQRSGELDFTTRMRDDDAKRYELMFWTSPGNRHGTARLFGRRGQLDGPGCDVSGEVRYDTETLRVSFPRRCLGNPRWLRFRSSSQHFLLDPENNVYADNPHNQNALAWRWSSKVRTG